MTEHVEQVIEPTDYFNDLKAKITETQVEQLEKNREFLAKEIQKAHRLGQKNLTHKAAYMWEILEKEMVLHAVGIRKYVYRQDVVRLIDNVTPKHSVKIVELENYPRSIPDKNMEDIENAKDLGIFDVILVVYTDLENEEVHTPEQKAFINRNRDPVVFGMFYNEKMNLKHDKLYFISDWQDEFCDLTFTKMIEKMAEVGIPNAEQTITVDHDAINRIVAVAKTEVNTVKLDTEFAIQYPKKKTFASKIKGLFGL